MTLWDEIPPPVLFNTWKHHAGDLRHHIASIGRQGEAALQRLPDELLVIGTELMDLYTGDLSSAEIARQILSTLEADGHLEADRYRQWVAGGGGYRVITLPEDGSRWVLRVGEADRYVHLHPGRWSPQTRRVRANVLKTAVMVLSHVAVRGGDPRRIATINEVRRRRLDLSPIRSLSGGEGLGAVIDLLDRG